MYLSICGGGSCCLFFFLNPILLEDTHEGSLIRWRLESTVSEFGRCIDELEIDLLKSDTFGMNEEGLKQN